MTNYLLDSNIWIAYFQGDARIDKNMIENESHHTAEIALAEITERLLHNNRTDIECDAAMRIIRAKTKLVALDYTDFIKAGKLKHAIRKSKPKFGLFDALHLQAALKTQMTLLTLDKDFKDIKNAQVI